ncbi:hypothetical protein BDV93DRAFT_75274 [Ceratobasidium sp. AG-I]|nr:hypothetical protein BDV93DRAFT_75274 [Ceratobasidium sp. AG-I]
MVVFGRLFFSFFVTLACVLRRIISLYFLKLGGIVQRRVCSASPSVVLRDNREVLIPITIQIVQWQESTPKAQSSRTRMHRNDYLKIKGPQRHTRFTPTYSNRNALRNLAPSLQSGRTVQLHYKVSG